MNSGTTRSNIISVNNFFGKGNYGFLKLQGSILEIKIRKKDELQNSLKVIKGE